MLWIIVLALVILAIAGGLAVRHVKYVCGQSLRLREPIHAGCVEIGDVHTVRSLRRPWNADRRSPIGDSAHVSR